MAEGAEQEDKTEEPTQRRLDQAIERGDVATSAEINTFAILGAFTLALVIAAPSIAQSLTQGLKAYLANAHTLPDDATAMKQAATRGLWLWLQAVAVPVGMAAAAGLAAGLLQHPLVLTTETLMPKFDRISPMAGVKRLMGIEALFQFGKGLAKIGAVGIVGAVLLWNDRDRLEVFARLDPAGSLSAILSLSLRLLAGMLCMHLAITLGDAFYARFRWRKRHRMSKEEMKQEMKEADGNPEVKGRMKQLRMARVKKRMMAAVPTATVVVTNPTHYAVALRYEAGMAAPICVAKGVDALALRIRTVAAEHGVAVIENPPLARALHATVEIDREIPAEHYRAVAEVIGFVLRLRRRAA
ncbi:MULTISPECIES: flagellar biosynthesis protein FlhB [Methylobacterium]|jgi:flagellar biosynthetic protein FlhB|uniref:Flagellar biosynthetic protein FlhB n=1 Tax=Methylobacterium brachiatum TaxID=269660 RepID=A0ABV1RBK8_9HYPH|nr:MULTISPECIES: flagellar biosynthesis protein FlhB [Methylobacterium]AYO82479.1 flagellar biosynthesis protein FlhB [Methylobacterium brachiatum]EIZ81494.1 flagellar biosynthetic protein FlhB [Methylobacterium sp. GXF4]MDF2601610.1 flagellar biosynthesis protein FlhB [Methylobacterium brachiatum]MDH2311863.1 flagellar biosynthesis protein FlhB [Methylobacterium brachiatum]CAA2159429.1 Flagellar biosynthetic protein FlhB [Methylobacterium brachiatum]